jgi:hypothetical protein
MGEGQGEGDRDMSPGQNFVLHQHKGLFIHLPAFLLFLPLLIVTLPSLGQSFQGLGGPPPILRITGLFLNAEAAKKHSPLIEMRVNDQLLTFHVREVRSPTNPGQDWSTLQNLGGFLMVKGPAEILNSLLSQATSHEPFVLEGRLYEKERVLMLTTVELFK